MKRLLLIGILLTITFFLYAQEALSIDEAGKIWIMIDNKQVELTSFLNPTGTIQAYGGQITETNALVEINSGWLYCNGASVSQVEYSTLFNIIGYSFNPTNSNGSLIIISGEFSLPDLRGIFVRGAGEHGIMNKANGADFSGGAVGFLQKDEFQGHKHYILRGNAYGGSSTATWLGERYLAQNGSYRDSYYRLRGTNLTPNSAEVSNAIDDGTNDTPRSGDETAPASVSVNYIIKY